jgi:class 3 adenylate cyclase
VGRLGSREWAGRTAKGSPAPSAAGTMPLVEFAVLGPLEATRGGRRIALQKPELDWQPPEPVTSSATHDVPSGVVTFLFTDVEGSTRLWDEHPEAMQGALTRHDGGEVDG